MDVLYKVASLFKELLDTEYVFVLGKKNVEATIHLIFQERHFPHLAGLQHLPDLVFLKQDNRIIFNELINRRIKIEDIQKSLFYKSIERRLATLPSLQALLDSNKTIFKYNKQNNNFSLIDADYLLENTSEKQTIYIFLAENQDSNFFCRSFFPKDKKDYSVGQTRWTLLFKKKINKSTKTEEVLFRHKNFKG
ncbi:hypothetical protein IJG44_02615 [bacterium]|nr:hypothetical protein [bacterium]MBQ4438329.1 hypothetical protein [bacterium]